MSDTSRFDLLEERISHEREIRILSEQYSKLALEKQAAEYERRLSELNHAHEKALQDKAQFLEKALYEASQKEFQAWKLTISNDLAARASALTVEVSQRTEAIAKDQDRKAAALARSQWVWGIALTIISLAIALVSKFS